MMRYSFHCLEESNNNTLGSFFVVVFCYMSDIVLGTLFHLYNSPVRWVLFPFYKSEN